MTADIRLSDTWPQATSFEPPWIWITQCKSSEYPINVASSLVIDCCVRRVNGAHMHSTGDLLNELSAAFQFPWYFGRNYQASIDCLRTLHWCEVGHRAFVAIVTDADRLIDIDRGTLANPLAYLMDIAVKIGGEMSEPYQWADNDIRPATAFKFLFQAADDAAFTRLLEAVTQYSNGPVKESSYHGSGAERSFGILP